MRHLFSLALLWVALPAQGAQPPQLPPPQQAEPHPGQPVIVLPYHRVSAYAVWDYYAVDRRGAFKPRIIDTPYGAYRAIDGKPYPWVTTNARNLLPTVSNSATMPRMPYAED